jgi:AraC family transcriptional regulator of adaptative response/methylated-DNA-[protein]-cysteine methyltransferase
VLSLAGIDKKEPSAKKCAAKNGIGPLTSKAAETFMNQRKMLNYASLTTPIGNFLVVASPKGLCSLRLIEGRSETAVLDKVRRDYPDTDLVADDKAVKPLARKIEAVIAGRLAASAVPLDMRGTPFQKRVWQELARVPWGKTYSYSELARKVGKPKAVRAVASACARNPVTFVVPCHRIVAKGGGLGGYYWGPEMKQQLLDREK